MENLAHQKQKNPLLESKMEEIERQVQDFIREHGDENRRAVITIPIVFHIVHNGDAVGTSENIADTYIMAQLQQLNDDYRALNSDIGSVPSEFQSLVADVEVEFCLATVDPNGNPTTGIVRHNLGQASWTMTTFDNTAKPATIWDRDDYLNFWTANFGGADAGLLGYAQFPGGAASTDGVVCLWSSVGSVATPHPSGGNYAMGRTATHEIGHWLNLYHIWGDDGTACTGSDSVADTPNQGGSYGGCPTYPQTSCSSSDMFMNYMDYVYDACMFMFTAGQKARVVATLNGTRSSLLTSAATRCSAPVPDFSIAATPTTQTVCAGTSTTYTINLSAISGYTGSVSLSASGNPAGTSVAFSPSSVAPTGSSTMTVSGTAAPGTYTITVTGTDGTLTHTTNVTYIVTATSVGATSLSSPSNGATGVVTSPALSWAATSGAATYDLQVATDAAFASIVSNQTGLTGTSYTASGLSTTTTYHWRVRGVSSCATGAWSTAFSFTTGSVTPCDQFAAGPYIDFGDALCYDICATPLELTTFQVWANEAYVINGLSGGAEYEFSFCNGYNAANWAANISVYYYDNGTNTIGAHINTTSGCSNTFTPPTTGDVIVIIWTTCGAAEQQVNNGFPSFRCTGNGSANIPACPNCPVNEAFTGGQPSGWTFTVTGSGDDPNWHFGTEDLGLTSYVNPGTGNWANYNDDGNGSGVSNNIATATTPVTDMSAYTNLSLSFVYNFQMVSSGETVRLSVTDGSQTQYWNGTSWTSTATAWLTADTNGSFSQALPTGLNSASLQVSLVFNDNSEWSWGFGFDDFMICGEPMGPTCVDDLVINDDPIASDAYSADLTITSAGVVPSGNTVSFESQEITLQTGFHAQAGCDFHAFIGDCTSGARIVDGAVIGKVASHDRPGLRKAPVIQGTDRKNMDAKPLPSSLEVQVQPNPFSNTATVRYFVPSEGAASVTLTDMNGRALRTLSNGQAKAAGWHEATIESNGLAKGVYLLHVRTATESTTKKVVLVQ
jgi:hypothetical protein